MTVHALRDFSQRRDCAGIWTVAEQLAQCACALPVIRGLTGEPNRPIKPYTGTAAPAGRAHLPEVVELVAQNGPAAAPARTLTLRNIRLADRQQARNL